MQFRHLSAATPEPAATFAPTKPTSEPPTLTASQTACIAAPFPSPEPSASHSPTFSITEPFAIPAPFPNLAPSSAHSTQPVSLAAAARYSLPAFCTIAKPTIFSPAASSL